MELPCPELKFMKLHEYHMCTNFHRRYISRTPRIYNNFLDINFANNGLQLQTRTVCMQIFTGRIFSKHPASITIFSILILRITACSYKLVLYVYKFSCFYFRKRLLIREICKTKSRENLYAYSNLLHLCYMWFQS